MAEIHDPKARFCPECGEEYQVYFSQSFELPAGTLLCEDRYLVGKSLASGGFGITYIGYDLRLNRKIVIKETYYQDLSHRNTKNITINDPLSVTHDGITLDEIMKQTQKECRCLSSAEKFNNIVNVYDWFTEHNTAYIITEFINGDTLYDRVTKQGVYSWDELFFYMKPIMQSLAMLHKNGLLHRDIKPQNIMIKKDFKNKDVSVLIDFGLSRLASIHNAATKYAFTPGYAPYEQRTTSKKEGTFTDVYAIAATMYFALTGETPEDSIVADILQNFSKLDYLKSSGKITSYVYDAFVSALQPSSNDRCQNLEEFLYKLERAEEYFTPLESPYNYHEKANDSVDTVFAAGFSSNNNSNHLPNSNISSPAINVSGSSYRGNNNYSPNIGSSGKTQQTSVYVPVNQNSSENGRKPFNSLYVFLFVLFVMITALTVADATDIITIPDFLPVNTDSDVESSDVESSEIEEDEGAVLLGDYVGQDFEDVKQQLEEKGFHITYRKDTTSNQPDGIILEQNFTADKYYAPGETLNFVVAKTAEPLTPSPGMISVSSTSEVSSATVSPENNTSSYDDNKTTVSEIVSEIIINDDRDDYITQNISNDLVNSHTLPIFKYSRVSSYLPAAGGYTYDKDNVLHDDGTCWSENVPGVGVGEYFEFYTPSEQVVSQCTLING